MYTHFIPFTAILIDVLWDKFSVGGLLHLQRCQHWLLHPLRTLSVPSAGVTEYGPSLSQGRLDFLGFLTEGSITPSFYSLLFIYFMVLFWFEMKYRKNVETTKKFKRKLPCGFRTIITMAAISWRDFFPEASPTSQTSHPFPLNNVMQLIFIRGHVITWYFLAHLFVLIVTVGILSVLLNGTSPAPIMAWDIFGPQ